MYCDSVTESEVLKNVSTFKINNPPGYDNTGRKLFMLIIYYIFYVLVHIFKLSFSRGVTPSALKMAEVIPLSKEDATDPSRNFRPISLLSMFDKKMNKLMYSRLSKLLSSNHISYKYQYGFRKCYSISLALIELMDNLYTHLDQRELLAGIYLDLQKHSIQLIIISYFARWLIMEFMVLFWTGLKATFQIDGSLTIYLMYNLQLMVYIVAHPKGLCFS
jgi:hypothetical protein